MDINGADRHALLALRAMVNEVQRDRKLRSRTHRKGIKSPDGDWVLLAVGFFEWTCSHAFVATNTGIQLIANRPFKTFRIRHRERIAVRSKVNSKRRSIGRQQRRRLRLIFRSSIGFRFLNGCFDNMILINNLGFQDVTGGFESYHRASQLNRVA